MYEGAIYEAQTSDGGVSYHGYPYRGKLAGRTIEALRAVAVRDGFAAQFGVWEKAHIVKHGGRLSDVSTCGTD